MMYSLKRNLGMVTIFTILALSIGTASALDTTGSFVHGNGTFPMGAGYHGHAGNVTWQTQMLQSSVTKLGQQGADVAELQSDITNGNITAAMQWLKSYFQAHPDQMKNCSCTQKNAGLTFHNQTLQGRGSAGHSWV